MIFETPERLARFLVFMDYPLEQVEVAVKEHFPAAADVDTLCARVAEERKEAAAMELAAVERSRRAIDAEFDVEVTMHDGGNA